MNKLCECGCGAFVKNESSRFLRGHMFKAWNKDPNFQKKIKNGIRSKYNADNVSQSDSIKEQKKQTVSNHTAEQTKEIRERTANTNKIKFGGLSPMCSKMVRAKARETNEERYGGPSPMCSEVTKSKSRITCNGNYGVNHNSQSEEIKQQKIQTNLDHRGVENPSQLDEIKQQKIQTCLKNNGVENPSHSIEIQKKIRQAKIDSGCWISDELLSDYEKYRLLVAYYSNISLKKKYSEEDLKKRKLSGIDGAFQADHKFSIIEGFKNNIIPSIIGSRSNLELIPWLDNCKKQSDCSITKEELFRLYEQELGVSL